MVALSWTTAADTLWALDASPRVGSADDGRGRATLDGAKALGRAVMALDRSS